MGIIPQKENPSLRDIFAANIAGVILCKSEIKIDSDEFWLRKVSHHTDVMLSTISFLSYKLADKLLEERVKRD